MISEKEVCQSNIEQFIAQIEGVIIERICFNEDLDPTFDINLVPFQFKYCLSIQIQTSNSSFGLFASHTIEGLDTLWVEPRSFDASCSDIWDINSKVIGASFTKSIHDWIYKLTIEFENQTLYFYAAEIHDTDTELLQYVMNDEMIFVINNAADALRFEHELHKQSS